MSVIIRTATTEDSPTITNLSEQLGYRSDNKVVLDRIDDILLDTENCLFVADLNHKVVGWIHGFYALRVVTDPFVEIGGLVVDSKHRDLGVGRLLIEAVYDWARSKNCYNIRLRSNIIRIDSHKFYDRLGFSCNKQQKIFYKTLV